MFAATDSGVSEGLVLTSDSESEIFCDSVDSVEQLCHIKVGLTTHSHPQKAGCSTGDTGNIQSRLTLQQDIRQHNNYFSEQEVKSKE